VATILCIIAAFVCFRYDDEWSAGMASGMAAAFVVGQSDSN
jgi:hypothetical protein